MLNISKVQNPKPTSGEYRPHTKSFWATAIGLFTVTQRVKEREVSFDAQINLSKKVYDESVKERLKAEASLAKTDELLGSYSNN